MRFATPIFVFVFLAALAAMTTSHIPSAHAATPPTTAPVLAIAQTPTTLDITIDGKPFTTYRFVETPDDPGWHRPYFYPVLMPGEVEITADRYRQTLHDATPEHPWHRSVWVGFGDVNGVDHWGHPAGEKKLQRHLKFDRVDADSFVEELAWDGPQPGKPVLTEIRTVKFIAYADGARGIDLTSVLTAANGDVVFRCKPLNVSGVEAGWLAARVSQDIATSKDSKITSSAGATTEADARKLPANWCDYSGPIAGKTFGIAEFDYPTNLGHPTAFAVRTFGLLTHIGTLNWTLAAGHSQSIRHMLVFHAGDAASAHLDERYAEFAGK
jgi:hypothetical protein